MTTRQTHFIWMTALVAVLSASGAARAQDQQEMVPLRETITKTVGGPPMSLPDVQQKAIQANPTIEQAKSNIAAAKGRAKQAGLLPNPVVGGEVQNFAFRALDIKPAYLGFAVQTI